MNNPNTIRNNRGRRNRWDPYSEGRKMLAALMRTGGVLLSSAAAAKYLHIRLETLFRRITRRRIVYITDAKGRHRFPRWQFSGGRTRPGIIACLRILDTDDVAAIMRFFLSPSEQADDRTPLSLICSGRVAEAKLLARYAPSASRREQQEKLPTPTGARQLSARNVL